MNSEIRIKFKKLHQNAVIPAYANPDDGGMDLVAVSVRYDDEGMFFEYDTGLAVEVPAGYVAHLWPRSSISKYDLRFCNSVGKVDAGYRGALKIRMKTDAVHPNVARLYVPGDRIAQLSVEPRPKIIPVEVDELSESARGEGGFGSSGR